MVYFILHYELYAIMSKPEKRFHTIYKYNQKEMCLTSVFDMCHYESRETKHLQIPSYLPLVTVNIIITSPLTEDIFILFQPKGPGLWLMKMKLGQLPEGYVQQYDDIDPWSIELVEYFDNISTWFNDYCYLNCKSSLYILNSSEHFIYNFESRSLTNYEIQDFMDDDPPPHCRYCEFQDDIYLFIMTDDSNEVKIYRLNEEDVCLVPLSVHNILPINGSSFEESRTVSSSKELILVLDLRLDDSAEKEEGSDGYFYHIKKVICRYDPYTRNMVWDVVYLRGNEYLLIPEHIFV